MNNNDLMIQARFWQHVNVVPQSNSQHCWLWTASTLPNGYGIASVGSGKNQLAHRFIAGLREDITDKVVMHICDNPGCVRPDHLVVGTQQDNMSDMYDKQRQNSKLTPAAVRDIRSRSLTRKEYAAKYQISLYTVGEVQKGKTWSWVK